MVTNTKKKERKKERKEKKRNNSSIHYFQVVDQELQNRGPTIASLSERVRNPAIAPRLRSQGERIADNYATLLQEVRKYDEDLHSMLDILSKLMEDIDQLEDWLFPILDTLESRDLKKQDIPQIEKAIQVRWQDKIQYGTELAHIRIAMNCPTDLPWGNRTVESIVHRLVA